MKIHGTNQTNFNPYKDILKKQSQQKKLNNQEDQLEISSEAKKLQNKNKTNYHREVRIEQIKQSIDSGKYEIDYRKTAKKMIDFWTGK
ncbi:MAG TPA: flagellar biosynthesis anti-sigma factor FlgM [Cerasibacillus sp.]|uniref:flagellar biosynthesis anti-sigma factor FlgM n=1 Tax=Cerasibacillus sp. TaxID=2498711 RepID=UPI002F3E3E93